MLYETRMVTALWKSEAVAEVSARWNRMAGKSVSSLPLFSRGDQW